MKSEALVSPEVLKVFETVPDLYLVLSPELEVLTASDAFLRASRSEREEWVGKNLFDGSLPGNWAQEVFTQISVRDAFLKVISSKEAFQKPLHFHGEFPCTNGTAEPSDKFLRLHFTPGFNNQEKLQYLLVKVEDQTEFTLCQEKVEAQNLDTAQLREAQQALQQNQQLLQATLDSSMDMIQVFEAVRGANGEIIDFNWVLNNNTSEKWYGNVIGKSLLQLNPGVREVGIFDTFKQVVETGQADVSERHYVYEQFEGWYQQSTVKLNDGVATTTTDISALKKAEQELRQSKHLLQDIINAPHIGIAVYKAIRNEKGEVTDFVHEYMNRASIAMLGGEDFTGRLFSTHGENALEQMQALTEALQTGRGNKYTREANLNGRTFWFAITNTPLDADRLVHTWEDVTERKNAEEELRKAKELVQTVFDVSLNPIAYHKAIRDQNGNIVDFEFVVENQQARKYAQQDRRGQKYSEAYPGIRETEIFRLYTQVVETGHTLNKEVQLPVKGIDRWFHIMGVKLGDGLVATALDITENKNAVEEILRLKDEIAQHTEDKYKALFDSIDDGFVILEMIPDESGKWVDFIYRENNLSFIKHVGVDLRGKRRSELFLDKKDFLLEKYEHLIKTGESLHFEYSVDALNKQSFQATASRIGKEGSRLIGVVFRNITERKQRELQQEYLLKLSDLMQRLTEPNELKTAAMQLLGQHLGVSRAQYHECDSSGEYYSADGIGYADGLPLLDLKYRIDDFGTFVAEDFEAGRPFRIGDLWEDPRPTAAEQEAYRAYQIRAGAGIPLLHGGKLVAVLAVHDQHPHPWTDLEMELIRETAERVWLAVERLRAEEALRKSEEKYRTLFESIDEGYCLIEVIYNGKGEPNDIRFLEVNTAFENNTGVANITGKLASEVAPNEDYWLKAYHNVLKTATPLRIEDYNAASNRWYSVYAASVSQASPLLNIVFNDITERKQREQNQAFLVEMTDSLQRLTQPEEITQAIGLRVGEYLNLSSCLFVDVDDARNEVTVHYGWEKDGAPTLKKQTFLLSDYLTEEFARACRTGETVIICDTGNDPRTDAEAYARLKVGAYVVVPFHRDGRWVAHLVLLSETSRDWKEDEIELGKNIADRVFPRIERARAEEALRKSEEKFRTLFESIDEGFCLQELILDEQDQVVDLIYREVNDAFARHTGLTNAIGQKASELMPNLEQNWLDAMTHVYRTGEPLHTEGYQAHLDRWFTMQCTRVGRTGSPWVAGVFNDITERKRHELLQTFLLRLSDALRPLSDALEIQSAAMRVLGEELQVDRVLYAEMEDNGETYHIKVNYVRGAFTPHLGRFPASDVGAASEGLRAGETFVIGNTTEDERLSQTARATFLAHGVYATMGVPLVKAGCWVANLGIQHGEARQWTEENIALVKETAERTWAAVERAKAEEAMRASDQRLSKLLSLMPAGVYTCDAGGRITYYNQRAVELWGREPKLGDGQDRFCGAFRLWQPDGSPILHVQTAMAEAVEKGVSFRNLEVMLEQPNGTRLIANVNIDPLFDGEGKIMGAINVFVDITERKKAEEALQQSEEKYRTLFDSMDEGYCIIKILFNEKNEPYDWVFEEVNPAFEKNNGLHNATGKTIRELAPTIEAKWFEIYGHVASTGQPNRFEEDSAALNRWFSLYAFRVGLPEDRRVAVLFNDITQRKKSEAALIKSEEQFRQAIQDAPIPIIMHAEDGEVLQISRTWTELTGYHPDDVPTFEHWLTQAYGEGANMVREHIQQLFKEDKKNLTIDFPVQTRAKGLRHWSFSASSPGTLRDGRRFIVGMAVDITERKQSEEKLRDFNKTLEKQVTERTLELRQSRDMLQSLFDTTLLSFSILKAVRDEKGAIVDFRIMVTNKELERETGRTDLVGKLYAEEYPGIKQTGLFDVMLQVMETGEPGQMDYYYPHENFNKWYSAMFVKMDDGLVASNLGITARKAAEAELTRNFAILRQAEAVAGMGSWEFDYANNSFHWSEGMYHLFGLPVGSQKSPETYLEYVIVEDRLIAEKLVRTIQHYPQPLEETLRILVNQEIRTVKIKAIVWHDDANRPVRMLGVDVDVSEVKRLEQENLQIRLEQQKALLLAILEAQEEERRRISESLHNGVAQILYATKLNLGRAREHNLETGKIENQLLQTVEDLLTESIQETRRVSHELVPMLLQEFGLKVALESMCQKFEVSALFLRCEVEGLEQRLEPYLEIALFRMSQELVNNIVKHSGATAATITLRQKGNQILLQAKDNGRGIQKVSANQKGLGLRSIQDRVNLMNGTLSISTPKTGKGTLITIQVPAHD